MATPEEVVQMARSSGVRAALVSGLDPIRTVVEASDTLGCALGSVGNTVLVTVRERPVLVIVPGDRALDGDAVAEHYGVDGLKVSLASPKEAREHTGHELGRIPPFDLDGEIEILVDERLLEHDEIVLPSGSVRALLEVAPEDLAGLDNATTGDWSTGEGD